MVEEGVAFGEAGNPAVGKEQGLAGVAQFGGLQSAESGGVLGVVRAKGLEDGKLMGIERRR